MREWIAACTSRSSAPPPSPHVPPSFLVLPIPMAFPSLLGLGTYDISADKLASVIEAAIKCGIYHIDCGQLYGNQAAVGAVIADQCRRDASLRAKLTIVTKLDLQYNDPSQVQAQVHKCVEELQCDYLDAMYLHHPTVPAGATWSIFDVYKALESLVSPTGLVRSLGVSNMGAALIHNLLAVATIRPRFVQLERNPYCTQEKLVTFCQERDLTVVAYAPLGAPGLSEPHTVQPLLLEHPTVCAIAASHGCSPAALLVAFQINTGCLAVPKSSRPDRIRDFATAASVTLSSREVQQLQSLDQGARRYTQEWTGVPLFV